MAEVQVLADCNECDEECYVLGGSEYYSGQTLDFHCHHCGCDFKEEVE